MQFSTLKNSKELGKNKQTTKTKSLYCSLLKTNINLPSQSQRLEIQTQR